MKKNKCFCFILLIGILLGVVVPYLEITRVHVFDAAYCRVKKQYCATRMGEELPLCRKYKYISDYKECVKWLRDCTNNRDALIEIKLEIAGISWVGHEVILRVDPERYYYQSPTTFKFGE